MASPLKFTHLIQKVLHWQEELGYTYDLNLVTREYERVPKYPDFTYFLYDEGQVWDILYHLLGDALFCPEVLEP